MDNSINSIGGIMSESSGCDGSVKRIDDLGNYIRKHNQNDIGTYNINSSPPLWKDIDNKCRVIVCRQTSRPSSLSCSPNDDTIYTSDHHNKNEESMSLSGPSDLPGCSKKVISSCSEDDDTNKNNLCAWCQKAGSKVFSLQTSNGFKAFCSELCFSQCRRASFKKNRVCDWCKHVRHTVNYVDYQNGQQALQFCSDKCLNQYKMNLFCRETRAHLEPFSAVYRSPSSPPNYPIDFNVSSSNVTCESDKGGLKKADLTMNGHVILSENSHHKAVSSTSSPQSSSSLSPPPALRSDTSPTPSPSHSPNQITPRSSFAECIKEACLGKPTLPTNNFHADESHLINDTCINQNQVKVKIVKKSKIKPVGKAITNKQRKAQRDPTRDSNRENVLKSKRNTVGPPQLIVNTSCPALSTQSPPCVPQFPHSLPIHQQFRNRPMEQAANRPPPPQLTHDDSNKPILRLPHLSHPPHLPHPSHHHPYIRPLRPEYMGFRSSFPLPIPFNQQNLYRVHGHHRPPFPPVSIHHSSFPGGTLFHSPRASQSSIPLQFQPSQAVLPATSLPNSSYNCPDSSSSTPISHPFLLPLPMPIHLPISFPIRYDSSSNLKPVISKEDEVQVGVNENTLYPQFTPNYSQFNNSINNNVNLSKSLINSFGSDNQTRFRIDTLMHRLIDERLRSMANSIDSELISIDSDCNALDLKMEQSISRSNLSPKISNDIHDVTPCFLKPKRFKRDILSN